MKESHDPLPRKRFCQISDIATRNDQVTFVTDNSEEMRTTDKSCNMLDTVLYYNNSTLLQPLRDIVFCDVLMTVMWRSYHEQGEIQNNMLGKCCQNFRIISARPCVPRS